MANVTPQPGRPVSRLVSPVIWRLGALLTVVALICVAGVMICMEPVNDLDDRIRPAERTHQELAASLAEMERAVNGWGRTGEAAWLARFTEARSDYEEQRTQLRERTEDDNGLFPEVEAEIAAADSWLEGYAIPSSRREGGPGTFVATVVQRGSRLYDQAVAAQEEASEAFYESRTEATDEMAFRIRLTVVAALLLLGLSWILVGRARQALLRDLSEPLTSLEQVTQRMLKNDPEGRAVATRGPKEVRAIARALNDFADAQSRARAVEGRIQSELHVLDSAKDDFVSNVSHELRTPLTTISGYLEMVAEEFEGRLQPRHERMLEATRRNVARLRALIDDLLALSKAENRPSDMEPSDVTAMVRDAVTDVRITAARRGITVEVKAPEEPMLVVSDRAMLYRAFLNVLTNAVKFSHDDGEVRVTVVQVGTKVEIAVRDGGIGIPRAELDRLGTRFFRASNAMTNEIAGTGLGLRIVQTIIDKHDGDVVIESAEGQGTTVYVRLRLHTERTGPIPRVDSSDQAPELPASTPPPGDQTPALARRGRARAR